jgi:hypothetical protein
MPFQGPVMSTLKKQDLKYCTVGFKIMNLPKWQNAPINTLLQECMSKGMKSKIYIFL